MTHHNKSQKEAEALCNMLNINGYEAFCIKADVSDEQQAKQLVETAVLKTGRIDVLINNAGVAQKGVFEQTDINDGQAVININLLGSMYCAKYAAKYMISQSSG